MAPSKAERKKHSLHFAVINDSRFHCSVSMGPLHPADHTGNIRQNSKTKNALFSGLIPPGFAPAAENMARKLLTAAAAPTVPRRQPLKRRPKSQPGARPARRLRFSRTIEPAGWLTVESVKVRGPLKQRGADGSSVIGDTACAFGFRTQDAILLVPNVADRPANRGCALSGAEPALRAPAFGFHPRAPSGRHGLHQPGDAETIAEEFQVGVLTRLPPITICPKAWSPPE